MSQCGVLNQECFVSMDSSYSAILSNDSGINNSSSWIIDSGATDHMAGSHTLFSSYSTCSGKDKVRIVNVFCIPIRERLDFFKLISEPIVSPTCSIIFQNLMSVNSKTKAKVFYDIVSTLLHIPGAG